MKLLLVFLLCIAPSYSQLPSFGLKAGVPLTDAYTDAQVADGASSHSIDRYIIGPTVEVHLPFHFSLEADALYRRSSFSVRGGGTSGIPTGNFSVNDWQLPLLLKYEVPVAFGIVRPFADAGAVYRYVSGNNSYPPAHPNSAGIVVGGGIGIKVLHIRLTPEIRYTHWTQAAFTLNSTYETSTSNQADLLVGLTF